LADVIKEIVLVTYATLVMSTRQVFYQVVSAGAAPNNATSYRKVARVLVELRRDADIPYDRIVDRTRTKHQHKGWDGVEDVLATFGKHFRRDMWASQDTIVMIGLEKQALEGVFADVVDEYGASLWTLHGYGSESFLFEWATEIKEYVDDGKNVEVFYFGDHDPRGLDIERDAIEKLRGHGAEFTWTRSGLHFTDLDVFNLINVPVKRTTDKCAPAYLKRFGNRAAELDALPPDELQRRIRSCFDNHIDHDARARLLREERIQRESIRLVARNWDAAVAGAKGGA
jgi:hypothetical protein